MTEMKLDSTLPTPIQDPRPEHGHGRLVDDCSGQCNGGSALGEIKSIRYKLTPY